MLHIEEDVCNRSDLLGIKHQMKYYYPDADDFTPLLLFR